MSLLSRRGLMGLGAGLCLTAAARRSRADTHAALRPFTVEDLLDLESFGEASRSPDGHRIVFEQRGAYDSADRFDLSYLGHWSTSRLLITDPDGTPPRPLLAPGEGDGHVLGAWSPSGRRLLIHRLRDDRWDSGVVELSSGEVRWLGLGIEPPIRGETAVWRSDEELIVVVRADRGLPYDISGLAAGVSLTEARRRMQREGDHPATTVWGAGVFARTTSFSAPVEVLGLNVITGEQRLLRAGSAVDMALSPSGRWLAVVDRGPPRPVRPDVPFRPGEHPEFRSLAVLDLDASDGAAVWEPDAARDPAPGLLAWSPADVRLLVWARDASGPATAGRLLILEPRTRSVVPVLTGDLTADVAAWRDTDFQTVRADWLGNDPILYARDPAGRADWYRLGRERRLRLTSQFETAPVRAEAISGEELLFIADGATWAVNGLGERRRLAPETGLTAVPTLTHWAPPRLRLNGAPRQSWFAARRADGTLLSLAADGRATVISRDGERGRPLAVERDLIVDRRQDGGIETLRLHRPDRRPVTLARINGGLEKVRFAEATPILHPGADGGTLTSWLWRPAGTTPGETASLPLIIVAYPGASGARQDNPAEFNTMTNVQLLAAMGYPVLVPTLPRLGGFGPARGLTDQILKVLDACLKAAPDLDPARVGYLGHSFGGYAGLVLAAGTDRLASYVILSGIGDIAAAWGEFSGFGRANPEFGISSRRAAGWAEQAQGALGGPPWTHADAYRENSPLFQADRILAPVLLVHGEQDFIPVGQAETLFTALWRRHRNVQLVTYWGEAHTLTSPAHIRDLYGRIRTWFAATL